MSANTIKGENQILVKLILMDYKADRALETM